MIFSEDLFRCIYKYIIYIEYTTLNCKDIVRFFINDNPLINFLNNWREVNLNHPCDLTNILSTKGCSVLFGPLLYGLWLQDTVLPDACLSLPLGLVDPISNWSKYTTIMLLDKSLHAGFSPSTISHWKFAGFRFCQIFRSDITFILPLEPQRYRLHDPPLFNCGKSAVFCSVSDPCWLWVMNFVW